MSHAADPSEPTTPDEIRADIIATRAELAHTVDEITERLDVRGQIKERANERIAPLVENAKAHQQQIKIGAGALFALLVLRRLRRRRRTKSERADRSD